MDKCMLMMDNENEQVLIMLFCINVKYQCMIITVMLAQSSSWKGSGWKGLTAAERAEKELDLSEVSGLLKG